MISNHLLYYDQLNLLHQKNLVRFINLSYKAIYLIKFLKFDYMKFIIINFTIHLLNLHLNYFL